ncbi:hypothetical protein KC360_g3337 [Hortaea werneckii]|nr:hypothetical protein KC325_g3581 [Hortaea werneckii]KAI6995423.1 hypothetical protein KC359_g4065 [Hortaea werneckii]KAI7146796.1 hypothetical protein KC344_g3350 [Hortaea werneckii]KAI7175873.1 hypothetical protein KC360_g3337 [Hortaea werneckii]
MSTPDGERSPKRQRLNTYSPASPHSHLPSAPPTTKTGGAPHHPNSFVHQPQTPPPSVRMSLSWNSQHSAPSQSDVPSQQTGSGVSGESGGAAGGGRSSSSSGGPGSVTFPTPPSTVGLGTALGAPRSVDGEGRGMESEGETPSFSREPMMGGNGNDDVEMEGTKEGEGTSQYQSTDHERHPNSQHLDHEAMDTISDLPPSAPRLYKPPSYSNPSQPPHPIPPSQPHPTTNLLTLFNLTRLHSTIARKDAAGNKINRLRKSYEGKVKALGLQGSSRPVKGNAALQGLVDPAWDLEVGPEGETLWDAQRGGMMSGGGEEGEEGGAAAGRKSRNVLENETGLGGLMADFERVVAEGLRPGRLPASEHKRWEAVLGLNDSNAAANSGIGGRGAAGWGRNRGAAGAGDDGSAGRNGNPQSVLSRTSAAAGAGSGGGGVRASAPASPAAAGAGGSSRPERTGKKRRYDDASFDGYAQTFASSSAAGGGGAGLNTDDEGFSSSGGGGGGGKRPRVGGARDGGGGSQQSQQQQQRRVGAMASS